MGKKTPLYQNHLQLGAKIVDFGGWDMPLRYGSQIEEHHQVRRDVGMFDVSHMTILDLRGERTREYLRVLLANNVDRLEQSGKALYTCMLNEQGGVIDDLITYYLDDTWYRLVVNAATHDKDIAWIEQQAQPFAVKITEPPGLSMVAVQGPNAMERLTGVIDPDLRDAVRTLKPFTALHQDDVLIARTGYTGEDGFEIIQPGPQGVAMWGDLYRAGVLPSGLAARDTLRLEAGMNLYGADMDEATTPLESGLGWTVAWDPDDRRFIGREALERQRTAGVGRRLVGVVLRDRGVLRGHQRVVVQGIGEGEITSGSFSPTLNRSIGLARVPARTGDHCEVEIRGKRVAASVVKPPFVRHGKSCLH